MLLAIGLLCQRVDAGLVRRHATFVVGGEIVVAQPYTADGIQLQPGTPGVVVEVNENGAGIEFTTPEGTTTSWVPKADLRNVRALAPVDVYKDGERVKLSDGRTGKVVLGGPDRAGAVAVMIDGDDPEGPVHQIELKNLRRAPGAASVPFLTGEKVFVLEDFDAYDAFDRHTKRPNQPILNSDLGVVKAVGRVRGAMTGAFVEFPWLQTFELAAGEYDVQLQLEPDAKDRWTIKDLVGSEPTVSHGWHEVNGKRVKHTWVDMGPDALETGQIVQSWTPKSANATSFAQADLATINLREGGRLVAAVRAGRTANMIFVPSSDFPKLEAVRS